MRTAWDAVAAWILMVHTISAKEIYINTKIPGGEGREKEDERRSNRRRVRTGVLAATGVRAESARSGGHVRCCT